VLVTGGAGLVARHLVAAAPTGTSLHLTWRTREPPSGPTAHRVDLTDGEAVRELFAEVRPEAVIHTAYSMHDRADIVDATRHVAAAAAAQGATLLHLSTDMVFDGTAAPYAEPDPVSPVNDYGRWKAAAEQVVIRQVPDACITRTSLVVALDPPDAATRRLLDAVRAGERPTLFVDEVRCPIRARDLAAALWALVDMEPQERRGLWHLPGPEALSRLEIGRRLLAAAGLDPEVPLPGSAGTHPEPRPPDLTLASIRQWPGSPPLAIDAAST
jgi:dTDP-4-dehydrorhamnose reductase